MCCLRVLAQCLCRMQCLLSVLSVCLVCLVFLSVCFLLSICLRRAGVLIRFHRCVERKLDISNCVSKDDFVDTLRTLSPSCVFTNTRYIQTRLTCLLMFHDPSHRLCKKIAIVPPPSSFPHVSLFVRVCACVGVCVSVDAPEVRHTPYTTRTLGASTHCLIRI